METTENGALIIRLGKYKKKFKLYALKQDKSMNQILLECVQYLTKDIQEFNDKKPNR